MDAVRSDHRPASRSQGGRYALSVGLKPDLPIIAFTVLFALAVLGGGSSRADVPSLLFLRPASVVLAGIVLVFRPDIFDWRSARQPACLLLLLAGTIAVQLVPLPPSVWTRLPGHHLLLEAARIAGIAQPWRPISIAPVLTWNALAALTPPAATLVLAAALGTRLERVAPLAIIGIAVVSTLLSLLQFTAVADGVTYLYQVMSIGIPSGVFANRNHHAALLAAATPVAGIWAVSSSGVIRGTPRLAIALGLVVMFAIAIGVSGSRTGLVLLVPGLVTAALIGWSGLARRSDPDARRTSARIIRAATAVAVLATALGVLVLLRGTAAVERLGATAASGGDEQRLTFLPVVLGILRAYLPFGSGFGTFDPAFRMAEPDTALALTYFNHAHDDLLELVMTGGIPALLVLIAGVAALARLAWKLAWRTSPSPARRAGLGYVAAIIILLCASLTDYPLRTPLLAMVLTLSWMLALRTAETAVSSSLYDMRSVE